MWIKKELIKRTTDTLHESTRTNQKLVEIVKDMKDIISCYQTACREMLQFKDSPEDIEECVKLALILDSYYKSDVDKVGFEFIGISKKIQ